MYAVFNGSIDKLPKYWEHDPIIKDDYGYTVAMLIAYNEDIN